MVTVSHSWGDPRNKITLIENFKPRKFANVGGKINSESEALFKIFGLGFYFGRAC